MGDEVSEYREQGAIGPVRTDDEGGFGAGNILRGNVDGDVACVRSGLAGGDDEFGRIGRIRSAEGTGHAGACSCCSGSFHFTPIMLPQIAWCDQLVLDEDRLGNWNSFREHVQSECDELFSISLREIGY